MDKIINKLDVVFEDNHLLIIVKPPNILSQGDNTGDLSIVDLAKEYLREKYNKPGNVYLGLVHRLDRPVGGLMALAKTSKAAERLSLQLQKKEMRRSYIAIVEGKLKSQVLEEYIAQDKNGFMIKASSNDENAKFAKLSVSSISEKSNLTLCRIDLDTGRKHQIRSQLSMAGYPIRYDMRYGNGSPGKQIALWGAWLSLIHPISKERILFKSKPYTDSFNEFKEEIDSIFNEKL